MPVWAANDVTAFKKWMKDVFAPKNLYFMKRHQGTAAITIGLINVW